MKLSIPQQLQRTDFPEAPNWLSKLLYPLQLFQTQVVSLLTNQVSLQDNFACVIHSLLLQAGATDEDNSFSFIWPYPRQPIELVLHCTNSDGTYTPIYPIVSWNLVGNQIQVNGIQGLTPTNKYNLVLTVK